jgi:hypothetical protein
LEAVQIYENTKDELQGKATVFIATDHQEKPFFKPLADHYDLVFLKDFEEELKGVNTNCEYSSFNISTIAHTLNDLLLHLVLS